MTRTVLILLPVAGLAGCGGTPPACTTGDLKTATHQYLAGKTDTPAGQVQVVDGRRTERTATVRARVAGDARILNVALTCDAGRWRVSEAQR